MDVRELAELRFPTGYVFENGTLFYEKLGDERARGLLKALQAKAITLCPTAMREVAASTPMPPEGRRYGRAILQAGL